MSESKELLEATIKGLQEKVNQLNTELTTKQKELEDVNKLEMTGEMYDTLESCITEGIQEALGCLESDDLEKEFGMEYDGKVYLESFSIDESPLVERVLREIDNKFKVIQTSSFGND